ncbi:MULTISPECIES: hypothetical protein [unclassified Streptomyces]|uniref:hypothetical protein n=1 Tax=unclassified Streptomyces TaxID=2593676 RepID=UPI0020255F68|nr:MULTISPECIES: hypothetical protein [unclassified Streptomyces]MCX4550625.1 hypothetical protein [Streptomyces sp. NBC_01500]
MAKPSDDLIRLARASAEARQRAVSGPYSVEAWAPWREAAHRFLNAVSAEATATEQDRYKLEMAAKKAVQPDAAE